MKDLSKADELKRAELITDLQDARARVRDAQRIVETAISGLNGEINAYNALLDKAHSFRSYIAEEIMQDWAEKDDDWHGSPEAEAQEGWRELWDPGLVESLDEVEDVQVDEMPHAEELADLPSSSE